MGEEQARKEKENVEASFSKGIDDAHCGLIFGKYSEGEMITQLKALAMDPCVPQFARDNIQPLWIQILRIKKIMSLEEQELPWRKRKLEQFVKDIRRPPAWIVLPNQQPKKKRRRQLSQASSHSCLLNSFDSTKSLDQKNGVVDLNCPSKDVPQIVDSDESVNGSNPSSPGDSTPNLARRLSISYIVHSLNSPALTRRLEPSHRSRRLLDFIVDHLQRKAVPVGPRFQADIPEWDDTGGTTTPTSSYSSDSDNLKWLGSRVWPIRNGDINSTGRRIGKGRHSSCSCISRGTSECIRCHIFEESLLLRRELGSTFYSWKFDEMGEKVSESWSWKEQESFELLMKKKSSTDEKSFWNRALKCFPRKSKKEIVNYYFNVYIAQRMSLQRRSLSTKQIDTDDEEEEGQVESSKKAGERRPIIPDKKAKYLQSS